MPNSTPGKAVIDCEHLKKLIREIPDFPQKGILFYDITTLLKDKVGFATLIDALSEHYLAKEVDLVLGIEARGFIFGPAVAYRLSAGFVPVRKPGKLPAARAKYDYVLEYGTNTLEIHSDAIQPGQQVIIVDDLLATGGTAEATAKLAEKLGATISGLGFVVELDFLHAREKLEKYDVFSLLHYQR
ncbi:MAG: adenine phosphoribosyltransferase [Acidobacteria bacterium]|nr:adenine phosphoribosyltransferase [Acidobacteriota bacterium]MBV9624213.1 adenine phosphoribosyltransferase [Acidobacteriota bacterium]